MRNSDLRLRNTETDESESVKFQAHIEQGTSLAIGTYAVPAPRKSQVSASEEMLERLEARSSCKFNSDLPGVAFFRA